MSLVTDLTNDGIIQKMVDLDLGEEFCFVIKEDDTDSEHHIGVKCIQEFSSLLLLVGNHGGGFNAVILANDNIANREEYLKEVIAEDFSVTFEGCHFIGLCDIDKEEENRDECIRTTHD